MTIRGTAMQLLLGRVGRARLLQSLALPTASGDLVFLGDGLSLHGAWAEWFPGSTVRILGDEALLIDDARQLILGIDSPRALVLALGTADLLGLAGTPRPLRAATRMDAQLGLVTARIPPASVIVVGVPARAALGGRAADFNSRISTLATKRGVTFVPAPLPGGSDADG